MQRVALKGREVSRLADQERYGDSKTEKGTSELLNYEKDKGSALFLPDSPGGGTVSWGKIRTEHLR